MSLNFSSSSENQIVTILLFYSAPVAFWLFYVMKFTDHTSWFIFSSGLLLIFALSLLLFILLRRSVYRLQPITENKVINEIQTEKTEFAEENHLHSINDSLTQTLKENEELKDIYNELKDQHANLTEESSQTIIDLRSNLDQKQQQIQILENQIHDLRYEIKTLLNLTEIDYLSTNNALALEEKNYPISNDKELLLNEHLVSSAAEAKFLLKQCLESAQKITGVCPLKTSKRQKALAVDYFTLDLRLLFDALRDEQGALISVVSLRDNKLIFANNLTKTFLGYSPEKFVQDFLTIIEEEHEWNRAIENLSTRNEVIIKLSMKSKNNEIMLTSCHLGSIPTGLFRGLAIAVTYLV